MGAQAALTVLPDDAVSPRADAGALLARLAPWFLWSAGMLLRFHPILFSGFQKTFFDLGDIRLVNFTLEHSYRWLAGYSLHAGFWDPPIYYPHLNVAAYTDLILGAAPPYWGLRAVGVEPVASFVGWVLIVWSLNFVAAYILMRRVYRLGELGASLGAFLFAFGNPRSADIFHQQLAPGFFVVLALGALIVVFRNADSTVRRRRAWITVFFGAVFLQAHTAFYVLYFLCLALLAAAGWSMVLPEYRARLLFVLRRDQWAILAGCLLTAAAMLPWLTHYLAAASEVGWRIYPVESVPRLPSWVLMGPGHPWYGWLQRPGGPLPQITQPHHSLGVGPLTTGLALIGLYWARRWRSVRLMALVVGSWFVLATTFPGGFSAWHVFYEYLPGAAAIRAVGRIGMITVLPLALGVASFFSRLAERRRWALVTVLAVLFIAEQNHDLQFRQRAPLREYVASLAEQLDAGCKAFLLVHRGQDPDRHVHDAAAWITLETGIPTLNGRYGNTPPEYGLIDVLIRDEADRNNVRQAMRSWVRLKGLSEPRVCWIETEGFR